MPNASNCLSWAIAIIPSLVYPCVCWAYWLVVKHKRSVIQQILEPNTRRALYIRAYAPVSQTQRDPFTSLFDVTYNKETYVLAVIMNMFWVIMATVVCLVNIHLPLGIPKEIETIVQTTPAAMISGLVGAYLWGLYDILRRYRLADLSSIALHFIWLRLLLASALGYLANEMFKDTASVIAAFGLGALPLGDILHFVRSQANSRFGISRQGNRGEPVTLSKIQGLSEEVIERLHDEGIDSTERLAYADPIRLLLRTNFEWKMILDIVDQAALFNYVGDKNTVLRPLGIRGVIELGDAWEAVLEQLEKPPGHTSKLLALLAGKLEQDAEATTNLMVTIDQDPHFLFLRELWSHANPTEEEEGIPAKSDGESKAGATPPVTDATVVKNA